MTKRPRSGSFDLPFQDDDALADLLDDLRRFGEAPHLRDVGLFDRVQGQPRLLQRWQSLG